MAGYDKPCIGCGAFIGYDSRFCPACGRLSPFCDACPGCHAQIQREWRRCPACGRDLYVACPFCGRSTFAGDKCDACGKPLTIRCANARCGSWQFFQNTVCTECGKKIKK